MIQTIIYMNGVSVFREDVIRQTALKTRDALVLQLDHKIAQSHGDDWPIFNLCAALYKL